MLKDVSRSSSVANMSSIQMEEMIVKLRKENKKLREENEELDEDKLDLSQKIDILTKELEQCITIISRHHEERKQNKKKWEEIKRFKKK